MPSARVTSTGPSPRTAALKRRCWKKVDPLWSPAARSSGSTGIATATGPRGSRGLAITCATGGAPRWAGQNRPGPGTSASILPAGPTALISSW